MQGNNDLPSLDDSSSRVTVAGIAATPNVALRVAQRIAAIGDALEVSVAAWTEHSLRATPVGIAPSSASSGPLDCVCRLHLRSLAAWLSVLRGYNVASGFTSWISRSGHCVESFLLSPVLENASCFVRLLCGCWHADRLTDGGIARLVTRPGNHPHVTLGSCYFPSSCVAFLMHRLLARITMGKVVCFVARLINIYCGELFHRMLLR
ncbi:hypothetical protein EMCRGX_G024185 [Ephydatia muelleri]|eukprot:Em0015g414a